jgi:hypothetical protein
MCVTHFEGCLASSWAVHFFTEILLLWISLLLVYPDPTQSPSDYYLRFLLKYKRTLLL